MFTVTSCEPTTVVALSDDDDDWLIMEYWRSRPESMQYFTSGMVKLVSAIFLQEKKV
jgi:hypothetical protein